MKPKMKMPPGFPRYFLGDGVTPFKGPAMVRVDGNVWIEAIGATIYKRKVFQARMEYALPPLRKRVSVCDMADQSYNRNENTNTDRRSYVKGYQAGWKAARKARR